MYLDSGKKKKEQTCSWIKKRESSKFVYVVWRKYTKFVQKKSKKSNLPSNFTRELLDETRRPHKVEQVYSISFIQGQVLSSAILQTPFAHEYLNKQFVNGIEDVGT